MDGLRKNGGGLGLNRTSDTRIFNRHAAIGNVVEGTSKVPAPDAESEAERTVLTLYNRELTSDGASRANTGR